MLKTRFKKRLSIIALVVCATLFCLSGLAFASEMEALWVAEYTETEYPLYSEALAAEEIEVDSNGNTYVGGTFYRHYFLVKYDPEGNEVWVRKYEDAYAGLHRDRIKVRLDSSGNVCLIIFSALQPEGARYPYGTWKTMKHDPDGNLLWERVFDLGKTAYYGFIAGIDGDDGLYITGMAYPGYAIVKYDSDGNQIWSDVRSSWSYFYYPTGLAFDENGNVYVSGRGSVSRPNNRVAKYDSSGNLLWAVQFGGDRGQASGLVVDSSGVYVSGYISNSDGTYQGVLSKYDPDGNIIWSSVNEARTQYPSSGNLAVDRSGDLVAVDAAGKGCLYCHTGGYTEPANVSKYDPDGNLLWRQEMEEGGARKGITSLNLDDEGNIFLSGVVYEDSVKVKFLNLKFSPGGELLWRDASYFTTPKVIYKLNLLMDAELDGFGNLYATGFSYSPKVGLTVKYGSANHQPTADAGPDQTVECAGPDGSTVTLDCSGSTDPDGDSLTCTWTGPFGTVTGTSPTVTLPLGTHTISLEVEDGNGAADTDTVVVTVQDTTPPATSAILEGTMGDNGWYISEVKVTLLSTDSCSGVKEIHYTLDSVETVTSENPVTFTITEDGVHTVSYWAVDNAGNVEQASSAPIHNETTPPVTTPTPSGTEGDNGNYTSCVVVDLDAVAGSSGVAYIMYSVNGGDPQVYEGSFTVCGDGDNTVSYSAVSNAGNVEPANTIIIKIDQTPPVITITGIQDGATYELGSVPVASYSVTDAASGVATSSDSLTGGDNLGLGTFTYTVTATDNAGNTAEKPYTYEVIATPGGTIKVVEDLVASGQIDPNIAGSLLPKLEGAQSANTGTAADGKLQAFINQINAQVGKKITAEAAAILINAAMYMMQNN